MDFKTDFRPALTAQHLERARLYADRYGLIRDLACRRFRRIAEIGVSVGSFSEFMIDTLHPESFAGFDLFNYHELETVLGQPSATALRGLTHEEFFRRRLERPGLSVETYRGDSAKRLSTLPPESFDLIYIDGSHTYEGVLADTVEAVRLLSPSGYLVFNDYTLFDIHLNHRYGVVEVVNQLVHQSDFRVTGFALQADLFCDIALRR